MEYVAIAAWTLVAAALTAVGAPIAAWIFGHVEGRGGAFALHVALMGLLFVTFWVGHLRYGWPALAAALVAVVAGSAWVHRRGVRPDWGRVAEGFVAYLVGFLFAIVVRATGPTIGYTGGEEFLHFGLLNAVRRTDRFPPEDMWFAGEPVNYYYGGHALYDQVSRLALLEPRLAYNLALAMTFGLAAAGAYGLVGALAHNRGQSRRRGGAVGVAIVLLAGTLTTPVRLLIGQVPTDLAVRYGAWAFEIPMGEPMATIIADQGSVGTWYWWWERRVIDGVLAEVPLYSLLKADLHGHVTTIPFMILLAAVGYAYVRTPAEDRRRRRLIVGGVFPVLAAMVGWMNTWSLPGAVGIAWLAVAFAPAHPVTLVRPWRAGETDGERAVRELARPVVAGVVALAVGLLAAGLIAPFLAELPTNDGIGLVDDRSPLAQQLLLWGAFYALFALFMGVILWREYLTDVSALGGLGLAGGAVLLGLVLAVTGFGALAVAVPLVALGWVLLRVRPDAMGYGGVLLVGGLGLVLAMEVVHAEVWPLHRERLNTTYKVSMQAFVLCALAAGAVVTELLSEHLPRLRGRLAAPSLWVVVPVVVLVLAMAAFPVMALGGEVGGHYVDHWDGEHSIDALGGHDRWRGDQMEAIDWLGERSGTPVLLEAPGTQKYSWSNQASTLTGLPTVAGWEHQQGYRGVETYEERVAIADAMYTATPEETVALLRTHEVEYVWVGANEHQRYGLDLHRFENFAGIETVVANDEVTLYAVDRERLGTGD